MDKHRRTYNAWRNLRYRCYDPKNARYHRYGGRGITVCDRWQSYENFLADMGECPEGLSLDRIDNDGSYEPGNCRWATREEQDHNQARSATYCGLVEYQGTTLSIAEWAERLSMRPSTLKGRLAKWSVERAFTESVRNVERQHNELPDWAIEQLREEARQERRWQQRLQALANPTGTTPANQTGPSGPSGRLLRPLLQTRRYRRRRSRRYT